MRPLQRGAGFVFRHWPTQYPKITQFFGANPANYAQFGLPGHEGLDFRAPANTPYYAVDYGTVTFAGWGNAYGYHVIIDHAGGVQTIYAHATANLPIARGQTVIPGQIVGYSGNTGNSRGHHLHLTLKIPNHVEPGWGCCPRYANPLPHALPVAPELTPTITGWVYTPYLTMGYGGKAANTAEVNIRTGPGTQYSFLGTVYFGSVFTLLGETQNNYTRVRVSNVNVYNLQAPRGTAKIGPHFSADSRFLPGEAQTAQTMRPGIMKFLSSHAPNDVAWATQTFRGVPVIIRPFLHWGGRQINPQQFFDWTWPDVQRTIQNVLGGNPIILEMPGNEQNIRDEGWGFSWSNGAEYANWALQVRALYRQVTSHPIYYPGLSPGVSIPNVRQNHVEFFEASRAFLNVCEGLCVHAYFNPPNYPMQSSAVVLIDDYIQRAPGKPIIISEFSWNGRTGTPQQKGLAYVEFLNLMLQRPQVTGITPFVMSASNPAWGWASGTGEVWVENGASVGIAEVVGAR